MTTTPVTGTLASIESALPGGFTGARLSGVTVRPQEHLLEFALGFGEGGEDAPVRTARVRVTGVAWIEFEPRDPKEGGKKVTMALTSDPLDAAAVAALGFPAIPAGGFAHRLHAQGTDGALCFAAGSATLDWAPEFKQS